MADQSSSWRASTRRSFFRQSLMATAAAPAALATEAADGTSGPAEARTFVEPARDLPLRHADVIVAGGGPAGIAAALTAARAGARTRLFEVNGCLGGVWTAGLLTYIFDFDKPGLTRELSQKLDERDARRSQRADRFVYEPEEMKRLLEELCVDAHVDFTLHTRVAAAYKNGNRLATIVTESKSGREAWAAPVFIDATGDGDLGALAGCGWDIGQGSACPCQPMTLNALAVVRDVQALRDCLSFFGNDDMNGHVKATEQFRKEIQRAGIQPSYSMPTLFPVRDNLVMVMINHEYGVKPFDAAEVTAATVRARAEVFRIVHGLRKLGGPWDGIQVAATAEQIGVRDGRRIHGRYAMRRSDLVQGTRQPDGVARVTFGVDIHAPSRSINDKAAISHGNLKMRPYDIPLRALIARDVDGLLMAGRCISGDFIAHASYRVTGNAVAMGEAAGAVAALGARTERLPHEVPWSDAEALLRQLRERA